MSKTNTPQLHDEHESAPETLGPAEQVALRDFENDLRGMEPYELKQELDAVTARIKDDIAWQEALTARMKQMRIEQTSAASENDDYPPSCIKVLEQLDTKDEEPGL